MDQALLRHRPAVISMRRCITGLGNTYGLDATPSYHDLALAGKQAFKVPRWGFFTYGAWSHLAITVKSNPIVPCDCKLTLCACTS